MRHNRSANDTVDQQAVRPGRRLPLWKLSASVGASLGAVFLIAAVLILMFGNTILNSYGKGKIERAFAAANPGCALRIGELNYAVGADRLVAQSVTVSSTNATVRAGPISLTGLRWAPLLRGTAALADVFAQGSLDATNIEAQFPQAHYSIRCARLRASVRDSELVAEGAELEPLGGDEAFFAAHAFRTPRFHIVLPECRVLGLVCRDLLQGSAYRARSVHLIRPSCDALINCEKPRKPFVKSPLMVHEAMASIRQPLQVANLSVTNGHLRYCKRLAVGADPAALTIGAVSVSVTGLANRGEATAAIQVQAQGELIDEGTLKVLMSIPITPPDLSFHCSGSLSTMDLTRLNAYLETAERIRITSGIAQESAFEIAVTAGQARGLVRSIYKDLHIAVLDEQNGTEEGFDNRVASFLANVLLVRTANDLDASGSIKEGQVHYTRRPEDAFEGFLLSALWSGVLDVIRN